MTPIRAIGRPALRATRTIGAVALFAMRGCRLRSGHPVAILRQVMQIGWLSLPVVGLTALFTGAALDLQIHSGGERFQAGDVVPAIVAIGMVRELGPVLGGLMVAARVASSIDAEIGTMRVTEQIDALVTLSTDPVRWLVTPRLWAAILCMPVLVATGDIIGIMGGWLVGTTSLGFNSAELHREQLGVSGALGRRLWPDQGGGLRAGRRVVGMLVRHAVGARGGRRRTGHDQCGRRRRRRHPGCELCADRAVLRMIRTCGLSKSFGAKRVLDSVDLSVATGESLCVIGQSGTGKSVLLKCILGLERPDAGQVLWNGQPLDRARFMARFGMLFQGAALFDSLSVWQNVAFRLRQRMDDRRARAIALDKLARVGLASDIADLMPAQLSGGMAKRVGLARAIADDPAVIFFDEPTTGLDPIRARAIDALISGIVTETGATAITITHDMASCRIIGDRVALLADGRIAHDGPVADMDRAPALAGFLGIPSAGVGDHAR